MIGHSIRSGIPSLSSSKSQRSSDPSLSVSTPLESGQKAMDEFFDNNFEYLASISTGELPEIA